MSTNNESIYNAIFYNMMAFIRLIYKYDTLTNEQIIHFQRIVFIIYASKIDSMCKDTFIKIMLVRICKKYELDSKNIFDILIGNAILFNDMNMLKYTLPIFLKETKYIKISDFIMHRALNILRMDFNQIIFNDSQIRIIVDHHIRSNIIKEKLEKFTYPELNNQMIKQIIRYNINMLAKILNPDELEESIDKLISGLQDSYLFYALDQIIFRSNVNLLEYQNQTITGSVFDTLTGWGKAIVIKADIAIDKLKIYKNI